MNSGLATRCLCLIAGIAACAGCGDGAPETAPTPEPAAAVAQQADAIPSMEAAAPGDDALQPEPPSPSADPMGEYGSLLKEVVTDGGLVRYDLLAEPPRLAALEAVILALAEAPLPEDRDERLALWCNAYNANVLLMALAESRKVGFENVVKVEGFFDERTITVAGEEMTLNGLENDRIRPLGDPRIHAALVCAAMSCPPLRDEPYAAERIDAQLDDQCRQWVNDPTKFRMIDGKLGLSEILNWYGEDFDIPRYGNRVGFVLAFAEASSAITQYIVATDPPETTWLTYDWTLNQAPAEPAGEDGK